MDVGEQLRTAREARGWSIESLASKTRVQPRMLAAIEVNDLPSIPPKPFGRGFVRAYAREVGLDPERIVREYFAQFAPPPEHEPVDGRHVPVDVESSSHGWILAAAGTAVFAFVVVAMLGGGSPSSGELADASTIGTSGAAQSRAVAAAADGAQATPAGQQPAAPTSSDLTVVLSASHDCWITATADGERVLFRVLHAGTRETLRAEREITIRAGDAGALSVTVNGRDLGPLGGRGEVRTVRFNP